MFRYSMLTLLVVVSVAVALAASGDNLPKDSWGLLLLALGSLSSFSF